MRIRVSTTLPEPPQIVWKYLRHGITLRYLTHGLIGLSENTMPRRWFQGSKVMVYLKPLSVLPGWNHEINVEVVDASRHQLHTRERGGMFSWWNHSIYLSPKGFDKTIYVDELEFSTTCCKGLVGLILRTYFKYRHLRWHMLLRRRKSRS